MQTNIFSLIDLLVRMAGTTNNYEELETGLNSILEDISSLEKEIAELSKSMIDDKYFDASSEIVDRNIEISVSKRLSKLVKRKTELEKQQNSLRRQELALKEKVESITSRLANMKQQNNLIDIRIESADQDTKAIYSEMKNDCIKKIQNFQASLIENQNKLNMCTEEINALENKISILVNTINSEESHLIEVKNNLNNRRIYIDEDLKKRDEETLATLSKKLKDLETKKLEILTDPIMLSSEIKELILNEDKDDAITKLNEMLTIVKSKPYMEIDNVEILNSELSKLEAKQQEAVVLIENKKYIGEESKLINERIKYNEDKNARLNNQIISLKQEIHNIDNDLVEVIVSKIKQANLVVISLENSISEYHELMNDKIKKSNSVLAALNASYSKKNSQLETVNMLIDKYQKELEEQVEKASFLEKEQIVSINSMIEKNILEIKDLEKLKLLNSKSKDIIEQEKDKKELKVLIDKINSLKHRLSFDKSAQAICDEIEMLIDTEGADEDNNTPLETTVVETPQLEKVNVLPSNFETSLPSTVNNSSNELNDISSETIEKRDSLLNPDNITTNPKIIEPEDIFPEINNNLFDKTIEPAKDEAEKDYTFSELEDTGTISIDEFLKKMESEKN